jgi:hypothetical protein
MPICGAISISKAYLNFDVYGAANYLTFIRLRVNEFTPWGGDVCCRGHEMTRSDVRAESA